MPAFDQTMVRAAYQKTPGLRRSRATRGSCLITCDHSNGKKHPAERLIVLGRLYLRSLLGLGGLVGTDRSVVPIPEPPATTPAAVPSAATCISRR